MGFVKASSGATTGGAGGTGVFTVTLSFSPTSAGDTLVLLVNLQSSSSPSPTSGFLTSVTDNATGGSSTYVQPTGGFVTIAQTNRGSGDWMLYCQSVKAGVTTITANFNTGSLATLFASIVVGEYTSLGAFDVAGALNAQLSAATSANAVTSSSGIPSADGDTIIGLTIDWTGNGTITQGTEFTSEYSVASVYMIEDLVQTTAASIAATFTASSAIDNWVTGMMAFLKVTIPPPPPVPLWLLTA